MANAATWAEVGDAGDSLATSNSTVYGVGGLDTITGTLPSDSDIDLYKIQITDHTSFAAAISPLVVIADPDIWLFNASGVGIVHNSTVQFGACAIDGTFVPSNGTYYLGVSSSGALAQSAGGNIWTGTNFSSQYAPDGPGAAQALSNWGGTPINDQINYSIFLHGADFATAPEPASAMMLALLGVGAIAGRRR